MLHLLALATASTDKLPVTAGQVNQQSTDPDLITVGRVTYLAKRTQAVHQRHVAHLRHLSHVRHLAATRRAHRHSHKDYRPVHSYSTPVSYRHQVSAAYSGGSSSFEQCVINRESGGDSQAMNGSGHYGLYQFDLSTWVSGGGSAADFGHASAAEQHQVFESVYAARGSSPWGAYDGC
jgi:hypothetical protein